MAASTLNIGVTGLNAAQANLITTGHNIANASTPGYTRQQVVQEANLPMFTGAGFLGQGTNIETVKRIYSQYLTTQVLSAQTGASEMDGYQAEISQINNLVADASSGLSPAMSSFFGSLGELSANPTSTASRQAFLSSSQSLVARFQSLDQRMNEIRSGVNSQMTNEVTLINSYAQQIADINQRIVIAQSAGEGQPANDLLDQRDQLIASLNKEIRVSAVPQSDGSYSVFIGTGQPLVVSNSASQLMAVPDAYDVLRTVVAMKLPTGASFTMPDAQLTGGTLGGLIAFRNQSLDAAQNALGRVATVVAQAFNDQHKLGQDLTGELGGDFFHVPTPTVFESTSNVLSGVSVTASIVNVSQLTTSDYLLTSNGGGNYTLLRLSDNKVLLSNGALPASVDGLAITPSAAAPAGSSYVISPTRTGARDIAMVVDDTRNIALAAPIRTSAALSNSGSGTVSPGVVSSVASLPLASSITLTYNKLTNTLSGFPTGTTISVNGVSTAITNVPTPTPVGFVAGATISFNGMSFAISGAPNNGDTFTIEANSNGVSDNRNALLLGKLQTATILDGSTTTLQGAYSAMVNQVGNKAREVQVSGKALQSLADQAQTARDSVSAVNLDEEAANLLRFQQAYQASAKLISVAGKLFDDLLQVM